MQYTKSIILNQFFIGRRGTQVVVPYRGTDDDKRHLKLMGDLGQIVHLVCLTRSTCFDVFAQLTGTCRDLT